MQSSQLCLTSLTNVNSRFLFVPRQDPDLDVGLHQSLDGLGHLVLELVLDGRGPQQLQVLHPERGRQKISKSGGDRTGRKEPLKRHLSEKHASRDRVTHFSSRSVNRVYRP